VVLPLKTITIIIVIIIIVIIIIIINLDNMDFILEKTKSVKTYIMGEFE